MADALGGEIDAETYELSYNAAASDIADALESAAPDLGSVSATRTLSGKVCGKVCRVVFSITRSTRVREGRFFHI